MNTPWTKTQIYNVDTKNWLLGVTIAKTDLTVTKAKRDKKKKEILPTLNPHNIRFCPL